MEKNNFMYEWQKYKQYYHKDKDGTVHIHEDAPAIMKQSYQAYYEMFDKLNQFPKQKVGQGFFSLLSTSKKEKKEDLRSTLFEVTSVFGEKEKLVVLQQLNSKKEPLLKILNEVAFWVCKDIEYNGFIALKRHTEQSAEIFMKVEEENKREIAMSLLNNCEKWATMNHIVYLQIKIDNVDHDFYQALGFLPLESEGTISIMLKKV